MPSASTVTENKVFYVNNLKLFADLGELETLFSTVGDVESHQIESNENSSRGTRIGIFAMATEQQALDCIERFHGTMAIGQVLSITAEKPGVRLAAAPAIIPKKKRRR